MQLLAICLCVHVCMNGLVFICIYTIQLFKRFFLFGFLIFLFKNAPTLLCLSRDKTKE